MHSTKCSVYFPFIEPYRTRNPEEHPLRSLFPIWRRVKTQKLAKTRKLSVEEQSPDVSTKTNQLHILINRRKSERRRNLRILSKWKLRMKSTHPSQSRPPYTFTYVKKSTKISLPDSIVIIIATSIRCELQMLRIYFLASV